MSSSSRSNSIRKIGTFSIVALLLFVFFTFIPVSRSPFSSSSASAAAGTANPSQTSLNMTLGYTSARVNLMPRDASGAFSYSSDSESAKFTVVTNNYTGYTLSIAGTDDTGQLSNKNGDVVLGTLDSISSPIDATTFNDPTYNGKWGYLPSKLNSVANTDFLPAPTTTATIINETSTANTKKGGVTSDTVNCTNYNCDDYTIGLGARVDYNTVVGNYSSAFILNATTNPIIYSITYSNDTEDTTVAGLPAPQSSTASSSTIPLSSTIPTRDNYTFLKWCLGATSNNGTRCTTNTTFNAGADFGIDQTVSNDVVLNAVWSPDITIRTNTGIPNVTLTANGNNYIASDTTGIVIQGLEYGQTYNLVATLETGYAFTSWNAGSNGSIDYNTRENPSTTYTVGGGPSTITPTAAILSFRQNIQVRYQDATGAWGNYNTYSACTTDVNYGQTHSCTIAATNEYQAASIESYTVTSANTKYIDVYRNTKTITLTKGTGIATVAVTGTGVATGSGTDSGTIYYGGSITITATLATDANYVWTNWTGTTTYVNRTQAINNVTTDLAFTANAERLISFQEATASDCGKAMYDNRGGANYKSIIYSTATINGDCWMTRNLDLPAGTTITPEDSNTSTVYTLPTVNTFYSGDDLGYLHDAVRNTGNYTCDGTPCFSYYSYSAATIEKNRYDTREYQEDICPKGWKLPTKAQFDALKNTYPTNNDIINSPFLPVPSGIITQRDGSNGDFGANSAYYWSANSVYYNNERSRSYVFGISSFSGNGLANSTSVSASTVHSGQGVAVRCVMDTRSNLEKLQNGLLSMQDIGRMSESEKKSLVDSMPGAGGVEYTAYDERDNQTYTIRKFYGRLWMTRNLAIGCNGTGKTYGSNRSAKSLTPADSNISNNWSTGSAGALTSGDSYTEARMQCDSTYGAWYNYAAASASTITGSNNSNKATSSICPKGWRLPTATEETAATVQTTKSNFSAVKGGHYREGANIDTDYAWWWSMDANSFDTTRRYSLYYNSANSAPYDIVASGRTVAISGNYIRCVMWPYDDYTPFQKLQEGRLLMQDIGYLSSSEKSTLLSQMTTGTSYSSSDARDGQTYTISKLSDGKLWMTRNLALGCNGSTTTYGSSRVNRANSSLNANMADNTQWFTASAGASTITTDSDTEARMQCNATYGAYYNYVAATAGTITGTSNSTAATYDICPKGWRLPTHSEQTGIVGQVTAFKAVAGGLYNSGSIVESTAGSWWSSNVYDSTRRNTLEYDGTNLITGDSSHRNRKRSIYIRCIKS